MCLCTSFLCYIGSLWPKVITLAILNRILDNFGVRIEVFKNQGMEL